MLDRAGEGDGDVVVLVVLAAVYRNGDLVLPTLCNAAAAGVVQDAAFNAQAGQVVGGAERAIAGPGGDSGQCHFAGIIRQNGAGNGRLAGVGGLGDGDLDLHRLGVAVVAVAHHLVPDGVGSRAGAGGNVGAVSAVFLGAVLHGAALGLARRYQVMGLAVIGQAGHSFGGLGHHGCGLANGDELGRDGAGFSGSGFDDHAARSRSLIENIRLFIQRIPLRKREGAAVDHQRSCGTFAVEGAGALQRQAASHTGNSRCI